MARRGVDGGDAGRAWAALDEASATALALGWEAFQTGNIGVGAVVTDPSGQIVATGRNRVLEREAPPGELAGCSLAHAEMNALAHLTFRRPRELTLTTSLQPCLQCAAAIRMSPISHLRIAGADRLWDGCHDFRDVNAWLARRPPIPVEGPRLDEVGVFATLMARFGPGLVDHVVEGLRDLGEGPVVELVGRLTDDGTVEELAALPVDVAFERLWPELVGLTADLTAGRAGSWPVEGP